MEVKMYKLAGEDCVELLRPEEGPKWAIVFVRAGLLKYRSARCIQGVPIKGDHELATTYLYPEE